jgi:hypothetical protein
VVGELHWASLLSTCYKQTEYELRFISEDKTACSPQNTQLAVTARTLNKYTHQRYTSTEGTYQGDARTIMFSSLLNRALSSSLFILTCDPYFKNTKHAEIRYEILLSSQQCQIWQQCKTLSLQAPDFVHASSSFIGVTTHYGF